MYVKINNSNVAVIWSECTTLCQLRHFKCGNKYKTNRTVVSVILTDSIKRKERIPYHSDEDSANTFWNILSCKCNSLGNWTSRLHWTPMVSSLQHFLHSQHVRLFGCLIDSCWFGVQGYVFHLVILICQC